MKRLSSRVEAAPRAQAGVEAQVLTICDGCGMVLHKGEYVYITLGSTDKYHPHTVTACLDCAGEFMNRLREFEEDLDGQL